MKTVGLFAIASILFLGSDGQSALNSCGAGEITYLTPAAHADFFAANFVKALERVKHRSFVTSPLSVWALLGMLSYGADGEVQASLKHALDFAPNECNKAAINSFMYDLQKDYKSDNFIMANKIYLTYLADRFLTNNFADAVDRVYHSEAKSVDFKSQNTAAEEINDWFSSQTHGRIQHVIDPSSLHRNTAIVLGSAISFNGLREFLSSTEDGDFYVNGKNRVTKKMMVQTKNYKYSYISELDAYCLELPFESNSTSKKLSMFVFVPNKADGLAELELKFNHHMVNQHRRFGRMEYMKLSFPKFKIESTIELEEPLRAMGLENIFGGPKFTKITTAPVGLRISRAVQKVVIEVDNGNDGKVEFFDDSESRITDSQPMEFIVNRPFLGFIGPAEGEFVNLISFRYTGEE